MIRSLSGRRRSHPAAAALLAIALTSAAPPEAAKPADAGGDDALTAMNENFRAAYRRARAETLARLGPVIVVRHDHLLLHHGDARHQATVDLQPYHRLKAMAHVPLALFVMLAPWADGPIPDDRLAPLREEQRAIAEARKVLDSCGFTPGQLARQRDLLGRCLSLLEPVVAERRFRRGDLEALARSVAPLVLANAADAAAVQIDAYDAQVAAWRRLVGPESWARLTVIVAGRQLPRKDNLAVQYFARVLGVPGEGPRLTYAEELSGDDAALDLVGSRLLDREIGRAFFDDPGRMERDLLSDGAAAYLKGRDFGG